MIRIQSYLVATILISTFCIPSPFERLGSYAVRPEDLLIFLLVCTECVRRFFTQNYTFYVDKKIYIFFIIWIGYNVINLSIQQFYDPRNIIIGWLNVLKKTEYLILFLMIINLCARKPRLRVHFLYVTLFCFFVNISVSLYEVYVGGAYFTSGMLKDMSFILFLHKQHGFGDPTYVGNLIKGTVFGHEKFGTFLQIMFGLLFGLYLKHVQYRKYFFICLLLTFWALIYSHARSQMIGFLLGIFLFGLIHNFRFLLKFSIALLLALPFVLPVLVNRFLSTTLEDASVQFRIRAYLYQITESLKAPILGHGVGSFGNVTENQILREIIENGIIGFMFFAMFLIILYRLLRKYRQIDTVRDYALGGWLSTTMLVASTPFTAVFIIHSAMILFATCMALLISYGEEEYAKVLMQNNHYRKPSIEPAL